MNLLVLSAVKVCQIGGRLRNTTVIVRIESSNEANSTRRITRFLAVLYAIPHHFVSVSSELSHAFQARYHLPVEKMHFIPNGINLAYDVNEKVQHSKPTYDIVTIGRAVYAKDHKTLIDAIKIIVQSPDMASFRACFVSSSGDLLDETAAYITEQKLEQVIYLTGKIPYDKGQQLLFQSKAFVLSSRLEGFGIVLLEGMRAGLPIISTDCPTGPREILDNGKYGILVPVGEPERLADAIVAMLSDPAKLAAFKALSLNRVKAYDMKIVSKQFEALL
jgi:glycosyltransferase involved in cell wall biosynthesis